MDPDWVQVKEAFGEFYNPDFKYKRCGQHLLQLKVTSTTKTNESRNHVVDARFAKFRASELFVLRIYDSHQNRFIKKLDHSFVNISYCRIFIRYKVGTIVYPNGFNEDLNVVCGQGIHYFNTLLGAFHYRNNHQKNIYFNECGAIEHIYWEKFQNWHWYYDNKSTAVKWIQKNYGLLDPVFCT